MTAIYQSPFLIALGWTIAASIWQSALLWLCYQAICGVHRKISPAHKHFIAFLLLLGSFGWFSATLENKYSEAITLNEYLFGSAANTNTPTTLAYSQEIPFSNSGLTEFANQYLPYISAAYLIVLLLLSVKLINAYLYSKQLKTKGLLPIDEYWIKLVSKYATQIGIIKRVNIYLSRHISVPATLNFFKPVILLPLAAFNHLTPQQVESIILHELAHIKRSDYLINIIASVIETILFFNPFVHLLGKSLKKEREHCCDDFVLQHSFDPHSYASALLSLEQLRVGIQSLAIAATGKNSHQLLGRIKRIMNVTTTNFNYGQKLLTLFLMAFIMISVAWLSPSSRNNITGGFADVYNDEAELKDQHSGVAAPAITKNKIIQAQKDVPRANSNKNKKAAASAYKNQNDFPALAGGTLHLPLPPQSPVAPPPPTPTKENKPGIMTILPSPIERDQYFLHDFTNNGAKWNNQEWLNVYLNQKEQLNSKISLNDLTLFMDASKIKLLNNQLLNQEQLQDLLKHFNDIQLQYENVIENKQAKRRSAEKKANNNSNKDRVVKNRTEFLFFNHLKETLPDIKKIFTEEKLKLDSIRKASAELAEKQKQIWLEQTKEEADADEKNSTALYELIVLLENDINFHPATNLQKAISVAVNTEEEVNKNLKKRNSDLSGKATFSFSPIPSEHSKVIKQKPAHRSINIGKNQTQGISL